MNKRTSLGNRAIALLLSIVMILGMLPVGVFAAEDDSIYGKVDSLTNGITITGSGAKQNAVYAGTLYWTAKDPSVGRVNDGWWAGIKVTAPATLNLDTAQYTSGGQVKSFKTYRDSKDTDDAQFITLWGMINTEYLRAANLDDGLATYT